MGKVVREAEYAMLGQERRLRLKKWSVRKFLELIDVIGGLLGKIDAKVSISDAADTKRLGSLLCAAAQEAPDPVCLVIAKSVDGEKLTKDEIMEWDPEDLLGVLDAILALNLTEDLRKNGQGLRSRLFQEKS